MGLTVAGITGMSAWATESIQMMRPGESVQFSGYDLRFNSLGNVLGPNYQAERATFDISRNGRAVTQLSSERRFYPVREQRTASAGIRTNLISNFYVVIGEPDGKGAWAVRFYYHPFAPWIWLGGLGMAMGGFVSLSDRRLRVGAPQRPRRHLFMEGECHDIVGHPDDHDFGYCGPGVGAISSPTRPTPCGRIGGQRRRLS
jgi:cytochrome c-type biogenesis protein CcmF